MSGLFGLLVLCGLPQYRTTRCSTSKAVQTAPRSDRFFLCIESIDPKYDPAAIKAMFSDLHPLSVEEVPS